MPKYDERFAQEAQEEEHLRHLDDQYWYEKFKEEERIKNPKVLGICLKGNVLIRGNTHDEVDQLALAHGHEVTHYYEPTQVI